MISRAVASIALAGVLLAWATGEAQPASAKNTWNADFSQMARLGVEFSPNAFLSTSVRGRTPGKALDIAMGQGRNAIMLAEQGWEVTGFDISDVAIEQATRESRKRGLSVHATVADISTYEFGSEQFDLIVATYANEFARRADDVVRALKPGGLLVVEGYHRDACPCGFTTNELLTGSQYWTGIARRLTVIHYEDGVGRPDMTWVYPPKDFRFVRLVARRD